MKKKILTPPKQPANSFLITGKDFCLILILSHTLYELRLKLAKDFNLRPECVGLKLKSNMKELGVQFNNQTLMQLQIANQEQFEFFEIDVPETPEEKLIN